MTGKFIHPIRIKDDYGRYQVVMRTGGFCDFTHSMPTNYPHYHNYFEVCYVISGSGKFAHGGHDYRLTPGTVFVADPETVHEISSFVTGDLHLYFFIIEVAEKSIPVSGKREDVLLRNFVERHRTSADKCFYLNSYIDFLSRYPSPDSGRYYWKNQVCMAFIFDSLESLTVNPIADGKSSDGIKSGIIDSAINYILRNLHRKIALRELAQHCYTCERNLQLLFRKHLSCTPVDFINNKRAIVAARHLLQGYRVREAGSSIGINDPAQFSRFFKQYFGETPKTYQQQRAPAGMRFSSRHRNG